MVKQIGKRTTTFGLDKGQKPSILISTSKNITQETPVYKNKKNMLMDPHLNDPNTYKI